jgi:hypothetical protein
LYAYDSTFRTLSLSPEAEEQEPRAQELAPAARMHTLAAAWWQRLQLAPARSHSLALSLSRSLSVIVMVTVVVMVDTSSSSCCSSAVPIGKLFAWGEGDSGGHVLRKTSRGLCVPRPPGVVTRTPPPPPGVDQGCYVAPTSAHFLLEQIAVLVCCPAAARMLLHASPLHMLELPRCQRPSRELREGLISWSLH